MDTLRDKRYLLDSSGSRQAPWKAWKSWHHERASGADAAFFVTGATGLLGSWLVGGPARGAAPRSSAWCATGCRESELVDLGHSPRAANVVRGELEDFPLLLRALNEYEVDTVFHLGAQTIVGTALRSRSPRSRPTCAAP